jgi:hypothetical protein
MKSIFFHLAVGLLLLAPVSGRCGDLPAGVQAVWDLGQAQRDATSTRERICINGLWQWQPTAGAGVSLPKRGWGYFKVPGPWPTGNDWIHKDSQTVFTHDSWKGADLRKVTAAWYQRDIEIPKTWGSRRIVLEIGTLNSQAVIYMDGKQAGEIRFPGGEAELSVGPGKHVLSLLVRALPLKSVMLSFGDTNVPKMVDSEVERKGLCGDVYLSSGPKGPRVEGWRVETSVRKGEIRIDAGLEGLSPGARYTLSAWVRESADQIKAFSSPAFTAAEVKDGRVTFSAGWKPERLWDLNSAGNQYQVSLTLNKEGGAVLDAAQPQTFGFREFWIQGRDFYLNGSRIFISAVPDISDQLGAASANYAAAKETFERLKSLGVNAVFTYNYGCQPGMHLAFDEILRAADDIGMLVFFSLPHFSDYEWEAADADANNGYRKHAAWYVSQAQNHPCVVMYSMSHNATGYDETMNPEMMDGIKDPRDDPWSLRNSRRALRAEAIAQSLDSSRVVYHHSSGNLGSMITSNFYTNMVPVQEQSDWFEPWSGHGTKPLFLCEFGTPLAWDWTMYRGWYKGNREFGSGEVPWELCMAEWNAQFLGDRAFDLNEASKKDLRWEAQQFREGKVWHRWDYPHQIGVVVSDEQEEVLAQYMTRNLRALRTWDVSGYCVWDHFRFWARKEGIDTSRKELPVDWAKLQRPGYSPDFLGESFESFEMGFERADWAPTEGAKAILKNNQPLLAYIAGAPGHFTDLDHNFLPGAVLHKQLIIVNNSRRTVACDWSWSLRIPRPVSGKGQIEVKTGDQSRVPLSLTLPADLKPGTYTLAAALRFSSGESQEDTFSIHVLARPQAQASKGSVALFDPKGETKKLLSSLGLARFAVPVAAGADLRPYSVLLIGKSALTAQGPGLDLSRVNDGLKVVVFEQSTEVLEKRLGFRVTEYGLRDCFVRVPDHPALKGLSAENLRNWLGEATLLPSRLAYKLVAQHGPTIDWNGIPVSRAWRAGNRGNVASVLIEKPAKGDFLPIVDGGFSLQYSPLLEFRQGKGMILFCQMDVTGRTEQDPAAQRLLRNILEYAATWKPTPRRKLVYAGDEAGKAWLQSVGLAPTAYGAVPLAVDQILVAGPGAGSQLSSHAAELGRWMGGGGKLLALGLSGAEANAFLPLKLETKEVEHISTTFRSGSDGSLFQGIGPADVHNRAASKLPLVLSGALPLGDGVLASAEKAQVVFCQILPWTFNYEKNYGLKRTFRKSSFLVNRLLANLGAAGATPLLARFAAPVDSAKERRVLEGLYLDTPEEWDDPYRFFGW